MHTRRVQKRFLHAGGIAGRGQGRADTCKFVFMCSCTRLVCVFTLQSVGVVCSLSTSLFNLSALEGLV